MGSSFIRSAFYFALLTFVIACNPLSARKAAEIHNDPSETGAANTYKEQPGFDGVIGELSNSASIIEIAEISYDSYVPTNQDINVYFPPKFSNRFIGFFFAPQDLILTDAKLPTELTPQELDHFVLVSGLKTDLSSKFTFQSGEPAHISVFYAIANTEGKTIVSSLIELEIVYEVLDSEGWTVLTPSPSSQITYVDSTSGHTSCPTYKVGDPEVGSNPRQPSNPGQIIACRTISQGKSNLRQGTNPDWLLLKRGEVWQNQTLGSFNQYSGVSPANRLTIASYGDPSLPRPRIEPTLSQDGLGSVMNHTAVVGIHFLGHVSDGRDGIRSKTTGRDLLIEDCHITNFHFGIDLESDPNQVFRQVAIRRTIVDFSWGLGLFLHRIEGARVEESFFDHAGWSELPGIDNPKGTQNRNVYIQVSTRRVRWVRNFSTRSSSGGIQMRPGGTMSESVFARNSSGASCGDVNGGKDPVPRGVSCVFEDNLVIESNDITPNLKRGTGVIFGNIRAGMLANNVLAHNASGFEFGVGFELWGDRHNEDDYGMNDLRFENNFLYEWPTPVRLHGGIPGEQYKNVHIRENEFYVNVLYGSGHSRIIRHMKTNSSADSYLEGFNYSGNTYYSEIGLDKYFEMGDQTPEKIGPDEWILPSYAGETDGTFLSTLPSFSDPDRSLGSYCEAIGCSCSGPCSNDDFYLEMKKQRKGDWKAELEARSVINYYRNGFDLLEI